MTSLKCSIYCDSHGRRRRRRRHSHRSSRLFFRRFRRSRYFGLHRRR